MIEEHRAMLKDLAAGLRAGRYKHVAWDARNEGGITADYLCALPDNGFSMKVWTSHDVYPVDVKGKPAGCGTACCIGGWLEKLHSLNFDELYPDDDALNMLLYNWFPEDPTPEQAADAIESYLAGAEDPWAIFKTAEFGWDHSNDDDEDY